MSETQYQSYEEASADVRRCTTCGKPTETIVGRYVVDHAVWYALEPCSKLSCSKHCRCN